jgi:uncharacterized CHY-type Zn-finger protein
MNFIEFNTNYCRLISNNNYKNDTKNNDKKNNDKKNNDKKNNDKNDKYDKNNKLIKRCTHYNNKMEIYTLCCNKYYKCFQCHNENSDHKVTPKYIQKIRCTNCNTINKKGNFCEKCNIIISKNYCSICHIWNDNDSYHCHKCKKCKIGKENENFHCDTCNICFNIRILERHKCNLFSMDEDCPICLDKMHKEDIKTLKCGHNLHLNCFNKLLQSTSLINKCCMICRASI